MGPTLIPGTRHTASATLQVAHGPAGGATQEGHGPQAAWGGGGLRPVSRPLACRPGGYAPAAAAAAAAPPPPPAAQGGANQEEAVQFLANKHQEYQTELPPLDGVPPPMAVCSAPIASLHGDLGVREAGAADGASLVEEYNARLSAMYVARVLDHNPTEIEAFRTVNGLLSMGLYDVSGNFAPSDYLLGGLPLARVGAALSELIGRPATGGMAHGAGAAATGQSSPASPAVRQNVFEHAGDQVSALLRLSELSALASCDRSARAALSKYVVGRRLSSASRSGFVLLPHTRSVSEAPPILESHLDSKLLATGFRLCRLSREAIRSRAPRAVRQIIEAALGASVFVVCEGLFDSKRTKNAAGDEESLEEWLSRPDSVAGFFRPTSARGGLAGASADPLAYGPFTTPRRDDEWLHRTDRGSVDRRSSTSTGSTMHLKGMGSLCAAGGVEGGRHAVTAVEAFDSLQALHLSGFTTYATPGETADGRSGGANAPLSDRTHHIWRAAGIRHATFDLGPGDGYFVPAGASHQVVPVGAPAVATTIAWSFLPPARTAALALAYTRYSFLHMRSRLGRRPGKAEVIAPLDRLQRLIDINQRPRRGAKN